MIHPGKPTNYQASLLMNALWQKATDAIARWTRIPVLGNFISEGLLGGTSCTWIPVNKQLEAAQSTTLPAEMMKDLVRRSSHRTILRDCPCRQGCGCEDYPRDLGCIFLGDATKDMDPSYAKHATVEEALAHIDRAVEAGLPGTVGHVPFDALMTGVEPITHFLTICFCCSCCCIIMRNGMAYDDFSVRQKKFFSLDGVSVDISKDDCTGCWSCVEECFVGAISNVDGVATIDKQICKKCGLCIQHCPVEAISIKVDAPDEMEKSLYDRISCVDISSTLPGKKVNTTARNQAPHPRKLFPGPEKDL